MIKGYQILKSQFQSSNTMYFEALKEGTDKKFLIQIPDADFPTLDDLVSLKNDYEITNSNHMYGVLESYDMVKYQGGFAVVKEYFNGIPLIKHIEEKPVSIPSFLDLGIRMATILSAIHEKKIIHKNFNPFNILMGSESMKLKICNFEISTTLAKELSELSHSEAIRGSLAHISPEQTGRMNRSIDYRTDFYSLGVTFYQMLTGKLPFVYDDLMELVHAHIAKAPIAPDVLNPLIPKAISDIVMKLMAKNAEDRYQSAEGIKADLEECLLQWNTTGKIGIVKISSRDHSPVLSISEKLYGRGDEIVNLISSFDRIKDSGVEMVLVAGYSGIGKTRLINEIHKPIAKQDGYFTSGKFDQYNRDVPYSAFSQAFGSLVRLLLTENQENIGQWQQDILEALEGNGQVLIDIIPELELLIGKQPQVLKLGLSETKIRFFNLFQKLLRILATKEHPLVIFVDDLQWADSGSFELIHTLLTDASINNVLVLGAYRDNEVSPSHPLMMELERLAKEAPNKVNTITLKELDSEQVNQFIADSLRQNATNTKELTDLVMNKTHGNPFFIKQFVQTLAQHKLIYFDLLSLSWKWNADGIGKMNVTDNVVDLVVNKIQQLSKPAQNILKHASSIGNSFDIGTLSIIAEKSESEAANILWETVQEGFINPRGKWSKHYKDELWEEIGMKEITKEFTYFNFHHDRIQQAAYSLIPETDRKKVHLRIGRLLLNKLSESEINDNIFDILGHLNFSNELITDKKEQEKIAKLNFRAAEKAKNSNAYQAALNCYQSGMDLLEHDKSSDLYKDFLIARSECEYLCGNYEESEKMFDIALENADTNLKKAEVYARKMQLYENTQRHQLAIDSAKEGLALLGLDLPIDTTPEQVYGELGEVTTLLKGKSIGSLLKNKNMKSPELMLTMKILMNLWGPCYLLQKQNLLVFFILRMVNLSVRNGNSIESAVAFAFYGYVLSAQLKDFKNGYEYSRLGIKINEKFDDKTLRSKVLVIAEGCVSHWKDNYFKALPGLRIAHDVGVESNDLIYAGYAVTFINRSQIFGGENLESAYNKAKGYVHFARQIQSPVSLHQLLSITRMAVALTGKKYEEDVYGEFSDPDVHFKFLIDFAAIGVQLTLATYYIFDSAIYYYFNDYEKAYESAEKAVPLMPSVIGLPEFGEHNFYHSLSIIALLNKKKNHKPEAEKELLTKLLENQKMMNLWAKSAPGNFKAKYLLIESELALYKKKYARAAELYGETINEGRSSNLPHVSAIIFERCAEFYFNKGFNDIANLLIRDAWMDYGQWGAIAKVKQLEANYPQLAQLWESHDKAMRRTSSMGMVSSTTSSMIDLQSIFKASTSISGEVVFERLLDKLLKIVIENAGAQNGYIVMVRDEKLFVEAVNKMDDGSQFKFQNNLLENVVGIPHTVVQLVYHTKENLILNNPSVDQRFAKDAYIQENKPKSILCMPILMQGKVIAIIYLENNLASDVFTPSRLEVLNLLSGQMAISINNALLYANLENKVAERTMEIEKQKELLEIEKNKSDLLLLNILPFEIAEELKRDGRSTPKKYENVSVMFTDFKGFTQISERLDPETLVSKIDQFFGEFDRILEKHGIEKIKTIGDAYMCVSGLPIVTQSHAKDMINAALEIQDYMNLHKAEAEARNEHYFEIRIGINSGPVVAGVVGTKKFAFDIWGDTVNTAARMESNAEVGQINISGSTYELVKNDFECASRGKIEAKHKGETEMFFVGERKN